MCSRLLYSVSLGYRRRAVTHIRNYCYLFILACRIVVFLIDRHQITFFVHIGRELRRTFRSRSFVFTIKLKQRGNTVNSSHLLRIYSGREIIYKYFRTMRSRKIAKQKAQYNMTTKKTQYFVYILYLSVNVERHGQSPS